MWTTQYKNVLPNIFLLFGTGFTSNDYISPSFKNEKLIDAHNIITEYLTGSLDELDNLKYVAQSIIDDKFLILDTAVCCFAHFIFKFALETSEERIQAADAGQKHNGVQ